MTEMVHENRSKETGEGGGIDRGLAARSSSSSAGAARLAEIRDFEGLSAASSSNSNSVPARGSMALTLIESRDDDDAEEEGCAADAPVSEYYDTSNEENTKDRRSFQSSSSSSIARNDQVMKFDRVRNFPVILKRWIVGGGGGGGGGRRGRRGGELFRRGITVRDARGVFTGGIVVLLKMGCLLLAKTWWGNRVWTYLQVFSLCTLSVDPLKSLVPQAKKIPVFPQLQGLTTSVLGVTLATPVVRWALPDAYRTGRFWRRLLPIYFGYMKTKYAVKGKPEKEKRSMWLERHEWGGDRVHRLVLDLSGFYVKSAQILATKADFVPEPWIRRLSNHLDNAPPRPFHEVRKSIQLHLGKSPKGESMHKDIRGLVPLDAAFAEVEEECIAAASIAQVHGAVLKDGTRVVLKVQHLGMEIIMKSDLRNIVWVAKFLEGQLPFDLGPVVKEIQKTIPLEFNFEREMWFMTTIKRNLDKDGFDRIVCPEPVADLCSERLLVMERLEGIPFTRILHPEASTELKARIPEVVSLVEYLIRAFGQMLLQDGIFHADPHAGNLLLLSDGRLGLLDFGQSKVLDLELRKKLARLVLDLGSYNDDEIAASLTNLGMLFTAAGGGVVQSSSLAMMARIMFDTCYMHEATISPMAEESILKKNPLTTFNQALWLVVRAMVLLRGLCYMLGMDISSSDIWRPYALSVLEQREENACLSSGELKWS